MSFGALAVPLVVVVAAAVFHDDVRAIEQLRRTDVEAARNFDADTLASLATEDVVLLPPDSPPVTGKAGLLELLEPTRGQEVALEILEYDQDWQELVIAGDYAFEWALVKTAARVKASGEIIRQSQKLLRVLKRSEDGGWKVHRAIWNDVQQ